MIKTSKLTFLPNSIARGNYFRGAAAAVHMSQKWLTDMQFEMSLSLLALLCAH